MLELCRRHAPDILPSVCTVQPGGALTGAFADAGFPAFSGDRARRHPGLRALHRLRPVLRAADIVHTHLAAGDTWGRLAAAPHPGLISTLHNPDPDAAWRIGLRRLLEPLNPCTVAVSGAVRDWARLRRLRVDTVIPNGVDTARFTGCSAARARPAPGHGRRLLAIGRLTRQKGFDLLPDALPPGWTIDVLGDGPICPPHPQIRWQGRQEDIPGWMGRADALIIPSRWEGFSLVAAEGLAAGLPVVAAAVDALPEVLGDAALLVPPERPDLIRAAILRLEDEALRADLSRRALARAPMFALERMVESYERLYRTRAGRI